MTIDEENSFRAACAEIIRRHERLAVNQRWTEDGRLIVKLPERFMTDGCLAEGVAVGQAERCGKPGCWCENDPAFAPRQARAETCTRAETCAHAWSDWWCRVYGVREFRICRRCGGTEERAAGSNLNITSNLVYKYVKSVTEAP